MSYAIEFESTDSEMQDATYCIFFRDIRPGDSHWEIRSDEGVVATANTRERAIKWCEEAGE